ncbi:hypothetical protein L1987_16785 [Smallanthus sonchifolius]|uniref:Uncharacterized protein n=1 Tax=Smallanthus sonchifolius TaxID=185202 RepID=A0ACB9IX54_9ASTR|nr:hypothetical protein L1987_16785 [Smallanthus sonchifolius]
MYTEHKKSHKEVFGSRQCHCRRDMENGTQLTKKKWGFRGNSELKAEPETTIRGALTLLLSNLNVSDDRPVIPMSLSEPSAFPYFSYSRRRNC